MTSRAGDVEGCPRTASEPFGNAARATRSVDAGTSKPYLGHNDITDHPSVLEMLPDDPPEVVFLADAFAMQGEHPLLAVSTDPDMKDQEDELPGIGFTCQFRILPTAVAEMVGNLAIANMDFEDYSRSAHGDAEKIHRGFQ